MLDTKTEKNSPEVAASRESIEAQIAQKQSEPSHTDYEPEPAHLSRANITAQNHDAIQKTDLGLVIPSLLGKPFVTMEELRHLPIYVCTKDKRPINPHTGEPANLTDPQTWADRDTAEATAKRLNTEIGMVVVSPIKVLEFDNVVEDSQISPEVQMLLNLFNTYTALSRSGRGLQLFFMANDDTANKKSLTRICWPGGMIKPIAEIHHAGCHMILTGRLFEVEKAICWRQLEFESLVKSMFTPSEKSR